MGKYPIFLNLMGRRAVVIGGGAVAARKAMSLIEAGARLVVIAEHIDDKLEMLCRESSATIIESKYSKEYISEAALVIAATNNRPLNTQIYKDCQELEILCNVVDQPELCDFFIPAVVKRGDLQIAVCTEGDCPAYAGHIRNKLESIFTEQHGQFLAELETIRKRIIAEIADPAQRKSLLGQLVDDKSFDYFLCNGPEKWREYADSIRHSGVAQTRR